MKFKWDDDLVKEMIWSKLPIPDHYIGNIQKFLDEFKRSKQPKTKEYEILERFDYNECVCDGDISPIKSVKRLSDGELFSVGDRLANMEEDCNIIKSFWTNHGGNNLWISTNDREQYGCAFDSAKKAKEVLFTTNDGVGIFAGDEFYLIYAVNRIGYPNKTIARKELLPLQSYQKTFSTRESAEDWILHNKPLLSLDDLLSVWGSARPKEYYSTSPLFGSFKELAKSKL